MSRSSRRAQSKSGTAQGKRSVAAKKSSTAAASAPLALAKQLLEQGRHEDVLRLFSKLLSRNLELEKAMTMLRQRGRNSSERIPVEQLELFLRAAEAQNHGELAAASAALEALAKTQSESGGEGTEAAAPPGLPPAKQPPARRPPPAQAERVPNPIRAPDAERACPCCGGERRCVRVETTEVIDLVPAKVIVRLDQREVLACDACEGEMTRAPMGDKVVVGGAYGSGLVAQMLVDKYRDGLPLHRIGQRLEGLGLDMPSSSMSDQILWGTELLRPLARAATARMLSADVMHLDATGLPVRDEKNGYRIELGTLWCYVGGPHAVYVYTTTGKKRGQSPGELGPEEMLELRTGYVCADASNLFDVSFQRDDLTEVGCNMHARRYFKAALDAGDTRAAAPLKAYQALYELDAELKDASVEDRKVARQERGRPLYDQLLRWADLQRAQEPPSSKLGEALRYLNNHRAALTRFLDDGRLPMDNGIVERLHRRPAIVRNNALFAGSHEGARRAAVAFTLLASCELAEVEPVAYLRDVLPRIARSKGLTHAEAAALLPAAWRDAQAR